MRFNIATTAGMALVLLILAGCDDSTEPPYAVTINPANFVTTIDNPYLPLVPGTVFVYEGSKDDLVERNKVTVSHATKVIQGVTCVVVDDSVFVNGEIEEATVDWYAQDVDGNVWYFGEDSKDFEHGVVVSTAGSWEAGVNGAQAGITMYAHPEVGTTYRQEFLAGEAEDKAHVLRLDAAVTVPYGAYTGCLETEEWTELEAGVVEYKFYGANVGMLKAVMVVGGTDYSNLVSVTTE